MAGYEMNPKCVGERIAGVMDLPILAGIGEVGYVWIPIFFKGLKAFSCRQGRGVLNTPSERPGYGANDFVRYAPNGPFGPARGAYAVALLQPTGRRRFFLWLIGVDRKT